MKKYIFFIICLVRLLFTAPYVSSQIDTTGVSRLLQMSFNELMNQEVVTSSKMIEKISEAPSAISIITEEDIIRFNYSTLGEILNSQRGFYLTDDKNYLYTGSRGFSRPGDYNNRIVIMIDGHIMNEIVYGSAFMGNELGINVENIEKIELIRGPGASVYGSGAMLNTINIITKSGTQIDGTRVSVTGGNFGRKEVSVIYGSLKDDIDFSLSGSGGTSTGENYYFEELDNPPVSNGMANGIDGEKFGNVQGKISKGYFKLHGLYSGRWKNFPTGAYGSDLTRESATNDNRLFLEGSYKKLLNRDDGFNFRAYFDNYYYSGSYPVSGAGTLDESVGSWAGTEIQFYKLWERNSFTAGFELKHAFKASYKEWSESEIFFDDNFPFTSLSFYTQDQFRILDNLLLTGGLRYDFYGPSYNSLSPRLALSFHNEDKSYIKLLYSEAFRSPNVYETYYESFDVHKNNPGIKPERIRAIELITEQRLGENFYGLISLYNYRMNSLIDLSLDTSDDLTHFLNAGVAKGRGMEAELRFQPGKARGYINYTLQNSHNESGNTMSNSPSNMFSTGFTIPVGKNFFLSPEAMYETGRITLQGNKTDNVLLINITAQACDIMKHFDISFKVRNILNTSYKFPGGYEHIQDAIVQDSRRIVVKLSARF